MSRGAGVADACVLFLFVLVFCMTAVCFTLPAAEDLEREWGLCKAEWEGMKAAANGEAKKNPYLTIDTAKAICWESGYGWGE